jgi:CRISPR/Cas system CMR subunit Cmr6 (Cas7 group RAMP superfamily)
MTIPERVAKYNQEAVDNLFEASDSEEEFKGITIFENRKTMSKEKQYLQLIKTQEEIIRSLKVTSNMNLLVGFTLGVLVTNLVIFLMSL